MGQAQAVECPKCKMSGGIHRVEEAEIRGGAYWSCVYCGFVIEDTPPPFVSEDRIAGGYHKDGRRPSSTSWQGGR